MHQHIIDYLKDRRDRCNGFERKIAIECTMQIVLLQWERPYEPTPLERFEF